MNKVKNAILRGAISHYGCGNQINKAIEEMSELIRALSRMDSQANIAEEMADVRIMLAQLEIMFGNRAEVRAWELRKLQRLSERVHVGDGIGGDGDGGQA